MLSSTFRPWGDLNWMVNKLTIGKWHFLGCVSTEDRCLGSYEVLQSRGLLTKASFIEIQDPPSALDSYIKSKLNINKNKLAVWGASIDIQPISLLCKDIDIVNLAKTVINLNPANIILDITSFPKRFFFPFMKLLIESKGISNIIVTYTQPEKYSSEDLSDDPEPWNPLPLFMSTDFPEPKFDLAFVGTGFMPFSLPKLLKDNHSEIALHLFLPFPPGPPNYQRSWEFIRKIEKYYNLKDNDHIARIDALDINSTYNYIQSASDSGNQKCLFAPYGPKPISLAMCLYAINDRAPVYYTQPKFYNPDYSTGTKETIAYSIKLDGKNLFT